MSTLSPMREDDRRSSPARLAAMVLFAVLASATAAPAGSSRQGGHDAGRITIVAAVLPDAPPTSFRDQNGNAAGFAVEVLEAVAKRAGLSVSYVFGSSYANLIELLQAGNADLIANLAVSDDRRQDVDFTDTLDSSPLMLFIRARETAVTGLLPGITVGVVRGSISHQTISRTPEITLKPYDSLSVGLIDLLAGRIDAFASSESTIRGWAREAGLEEKLQTAGPPHGEIKRAMAVRKGNRTLLVRLNAAIEGFVGTPAFHAIYMKWYAAPRGFWTAGRVVTAIILAVALSVLAMAVWRYRSVVRLNRALTGRIEERQAARDALEQEEERFRTIVDSVNDAIFIQDPATGAVLDVNRRMCELYGYTRDEARTLTLQDLSAGAPPYSPQDALQWIERAAVEPQVFEWLAKDRRGRLFWTEVNMRRAPLGGQDRLIVAARDISDRKQAVMALEESEHRYRMLCDAAADAIFLIKDDRIVDCNERTLLLFNCGREDLIGQPPYRFSPRTQPDGSDSAEKGREMIRAALSGGQRSFEWVYRRPDGSTFDAEASLSRLRLRNEVYLLAIVRDVTKRKQAEQALIRSEEKYRMLIENIPDVTWVADRDRGMTFISPNVETVCGYTAGELLTNGGSAWFGLVHQDDRPLVTRAHDNLFGRVGSFDIEYRLARKDGVWIWVHDRAFIICDATGERYAYGVFSDVSARRALEEQLRQAQKMEAIGVLAGGIAHDFNNILSAIVGYASLLLRKMDSGDPLRAHVEHIVASTERAAGLTSSLQAFTRKQLANLRPIDLNGILRRFEQVLGRMIGEDITLVLECPEGELIVEADAPQIDQVLMNLAMNARDAMPGGGTLRMVCGSLDADEGVARTLALPGPGSYAFLSLSDTGAGMEQATMERIFEPFFTTKDAGQGTGLGLAIAQGIVKRHGGAISVSSKPGQGTTFTLYLPQVRSAAAEEHPAETTVLQGQETILLVEDEPLVREVTREILTEFGYNVLEAGDGEEAVRLFEEHQDAIDLVLCDLVMPRKSGREAFEEIASRRPEIKVVFMSGYARDTASGRGVYPDRARFVPKPLHPKDLLATIRAALDAPSPPQAGDQDPVAPKRE